MRVRLLDTGAAVSVPDEYGVRLIEQGKAVTAPEERKKRTVKKAKAGDKDGTC